MSDLANNVRTCRSCPMLYVFVEPFRPKEDAGLLHEEERGQLPPGLFPAYFLQESGPSLLQELQEKSRPAGQSQTQGWQCCSRCWRRWRGVRLLLWTFQQTPGLHGPVQAERQSVQPEMPHHGVHAGLWPVLGEVQEGQKCEVHGLPS